MAEGPGGLPTKFDLVINFTTAKTLGLTIPDGLLALAADVMNNCSIVLHCTLVGIGT
jgi:hypothetical protein